MLGTALLLLALFLLGALVVHGFAARRPDGAPAAFGWIGTAVTGALRWLIGIPAAVLVPLVPLVHALRLFGAIEHDTDRSWLVFLGGVIALLPMAIGLAIGAPAENSPYTGMWGSFVAYYGVRAFGTTGAWIAVVLGASALTAATLDWNPLRVLLGPGRRGAVDDGARRSALGARQEALGARQEVEALEETGRGRRRKRTSGEGGVPSLNEPAPEEMPAVDPSLMAGEGAAAVAEEEPREAKGRRKKRSKAEEAADRAEEIAAAIDATASPADAGGDEVPVADLLTPPPARDVELGRRELDAAGAKLLDALRTFRVEGELVGYTTGPTVTQYEIEPAPGVKVRQIANLANDLALAMRAPSIRIVAPIPGKGAVGVEVPNPTPELVAFRDMIESPEWRGARAALPIALGKDLEGKPVVADLAKMPHLLIAGATGSGKSVCVNTIITSLVYRHTPKTLRFLMVDPKMVELSVYNTLPHLRHKVITDNRDAAAVLKWAVMEMQERYELLAANGCRNIQDFNRRVAEGSPLRLPKRPDVAFENLVYEGGILPYIVVVIDEMADLMMTVQGEVETPIAMLAQKARAIGIHLILATQRPSVNVITGLIKANFPSRIAFRVASQVDSRTIIDGAGAEMLLGNGDMLFIPPGKSEPARLQGAYLSSEDTERLMAWFGDKRAAKRAALAAQGLVVPEEEIGVEPDILEKVRQREAEAAGGGEGGEEGIEGDRDKLFREAAEVVIQHQGGSTSLLQRRLKIGYGRAARIIDQLHLAGVLGPPDASKPRDVLVGLEELDRICGGRG